MKKLLSVLFVVCSSFSVISCSNKVQDEINYEEIEVEETLQKYADVHNRGLKYIQLDLEKASGVYSRCRLDSVFDNFVIYQYGKTGADKILSEIGPMKNNVFNSTMPSLKKTRNCGVDMFTAHANDFAKEALTECMSKIAARLKGVKDGKIFDNKPLLSDLKAIINENYALYMKKCSSDEDAKALAQTFGVLSGSIEYWTNSNNVKSWSKVSMVVEEEVSSEGIFKSAKTVGKEKEKDKNKKKKEKDKKEKTEKTEKLTKSDWIQTVASADAAGALIGSSVPGLGSSALATAFSAAAALSFDVE